MLLLIFTQVLYNSIKFTKSPKSCDLFQRREARISIVVNFLHILFITYVISRWAKGFAYTPSEKIVFGIMQLAFSILKFSKNDSIQKNKSS
jgi:hypothetical protein